MTINSKMGNYNILRPFTITRGRSNILPPALKITDQGCLPSDQNGNLPKKNCRNLCAVLCEAIRPCVITREDGVIITPVLVITDQNLDLEIRARS